MANGIVTFKIQKTFLITALLMKYTYWGHDVK